MSKMKVAMRAVILSAVFVMLFAFSAFAATTLTVSGDGTGSPMNPFTINDILGDNTAAGKEYVIKVPSSSAEYLYYDLYFTGAEEGLTLGFVTANQTVYAKDTVQYTNRGVEAGKKIYYAFYATIGFKPNTTVTLKVHYCKDKPTYSYADAGSGKCKKTTKHQCGTCGAGLDDDQVATVDHVAGKVDIVAGTCTAAGSKKTHCANCGVIYKTEAYGSVAGHDYSVVEKFGSGEHKVKCKNCTEYETEAHTLNNSGVCTKCGYKYTSGSSWNYMGPVKISSLNVTALSSGMVNITFSPDKSNTTSGKCKFEIYAGSKKVKTVKNTGKNTYYVTYSAKSASKAKYKVVVVDSKDASRKVASGAKKAVSNNKTVKFSYSMNPRSTQYKSLTVIWRPSKIAKSGNKITVSGAWLDTHIATIKGVKTKVVLTYVGADGKRVAIGTKTLKAKKMKPYYKKSTKWTFKLSAAKLKKIDLKNGGYIDWSSSLLSWGY